MKIEVPSTVLKIADRVASWSKHLIVPEGIARALIEEAKHRAMHKGMSRLELDVWSENKEAKAAFQALGFTTFNEKMVKEL